MPSRCCPMDGRPVVALLLRELAAAGVRRGDRRHRPPRRAGRAARRRRERLRVAVRYARQASARRLRRRRPRGRAGEPPYLVLAADTRLHPRRRRVVRPGVADRAPRARSPSSRPARAPCEIRDGRRRARARTRAALAAPLWAVGPAVAVHERALPASRPCELAQRVSACDRRGRADCGGSRSARRAT